MSIENPSTNSRNGHVYNDVNRPCENENGVTKNKSQMPVLTELTPDEQNLLLNVERFFKKRRRRVPSPDSEEFDLQIIQEKLDLSDEETASLVEIVKKHRKIDAIEQSHTREDLRDAIAGVGEFVFDNGSSLTSKAMIHLIDGAFEGSIDLSRVPEDFGIRATVTRILIEEMEISDPIHISQNQFDAIKSYHKLDFVAYMKGSSPDPLGFEGSYPAIGADGLRVNGRLVNGRLVWCDGVIAIFETPEGYLRVPFDDINSPSGPTYGELKRQRNSYSSGGAMRVRNSGRSS